MNKPRTHDITLRDAIAIADAQRRVRPDADRFLRVIAPRITEDAAGHWIWRGAFEHGAPIITKRSGASAKRAVLSFFTGDIGDRAVRTKCGIRACVRPDHLEVASHRKGGGGKPAASLVSNARDLIAEHIAVLTADLEQNASAFIQLGVDPHTVLSRLMQRKKNSRGSGRSSVRSE